jgi:hypothetical protein
MRTVTRIRVAVCSMMLEQILIMSDHNRLRRRSSDTLGR